MMTKLDCSFHGLPGNTLPGVAQSGSGLLRENPPPRRMGAGWTKWMQVCLAIAAPLFVFSGCGEDTSSVDDIPPAVPQWVTASADDIYPQQGIRAEATASEQNYHVRMEWYENSEPDLAGYIVYRTAEFDEPDDRYVIADLRFGINYIRRPLQSYVDVGVDESGSLANLLAPYTDNDSTRGYFWELVAYDSAGNRSDPSARMYYRMVSNPRDLAVAENNAGHLELSWHREENPDVLVSYGMVRVYSAHWGMDSLIWYQRIGIYAPDGTLRFNVDGSARPMQQDCTYVFQLNVVADQPSISHAGSRAGSAAFTRFIYQN